MIQLLSSMAYTFLIVSYLASSCSEGLASLFGWRANMLFHALRAMLNDDKTHLAQAVYESPLINPRSASLTQAPASMFGVGSTRPSYIDPKTFAIVILRRIKLTDPSTFVGRSPEDIRQIVTGLPELANDRSLQELLIQAVEHSGGNLELVSQSIATWFTNLTARMTGAYKRRIQLSNFCFGLAMAIIFNISPFPRTMMIGVQSNQAAVDAVPDTPRPAAAAASTTAPGGRAPGASPAVPSAASLAPTLREAPPAPTGSAGASRETEGSIRTSAPVMAAVSVAGWLLTALSTLFGAPFWYNVLSKINPANSPTKGTGPLPSPPPAPATAAPSSAAGSAPTVPNQP